ncbi:hypothetical protein ANSO36C_55440 [Nostoc cf. commune SO-36]|uniref:Response regulatory domain-containing protein n=1 Tax=Nostoc cf. commune SO-36 TaxID=449208 RepID=A0ABM7Z955_NOSCO|nr:hypothetical protein [Nostoc commune]BDI19742.1 hypothetical protein ANSO36C_55440 [Nostoc cf. commune SO-36]
MFYKKRVNRFLLRERYEPKDLFKIIEKIINLVGGILISNICLPDEDGYSLLLKARNLEAKRGRKIPAIALTASTFEEHWKRALLAGYDIYRCKPIDIDEFSATVASLTELEQYG